jgi:enoyl-CoA hydratase/carnithine racemase
MSEPVLLSADLGGVRTLTLNRPDKKNAVNAQMWVALADALRAAGSDRVVRALVDRTMKDALANEARAQAVNFATADAAEAYAAFAEKRSPTFTGRWAVPRREQNNA